MPPGPQALPPFVAPAAAGCTLRVRVIPRAGRTTIAGEREGALLVRLAAAPVDGEANDALLDALAGWLRVPRRALTLASGARSRDKRIDVAGLDAHAAATLLAGEADGRRGPPAASR